MGDVVPLKSPEAAQQVLPGVEPPPPRPVRAYGMTADEWYERARGLRQAGLTELGDFYAENAARLVRGERVIWPPPAELKASVLLSQRPEPEAFHDDGREE